MMKHEFESMIGHSVSAAENDRENLLNRDLARVAARREARAAYVIECGKHGLEPDSLEDESPRKRSKRWFENRFPPDVAVTAFRIYQKVQEADWPFSSFSASQCNFNRHDPRLLKLNSYRLLGYAEWTFGLENVYLEDWFYAAADVTPL